MPTSLVTVLTASLLAAVTVNISGHALWMGPPATGTAMQAKAPDVSGQWRMAVTFPQGAVAGTLHLQQEGERITGTVTAGFTGGPVAVEGEFAHGKLTFSGSTTTGPHPGMHLDFSATVDASDKMAGTLSWQVGDFAWTAERAKK